MDHRYSFSPPYKLQENIETYREREIPGMKKLLRIRARLDYLIVSGGSNLNCGLIVAYVPGSSSSEASRNLESEN